MITDDRFDRDLRRWLEAEAPRAAPIGLHDAAIDRARASRQRRAWLVAVRGGTVVGSFGTWARPIRRGAYLLLIVALVAAIVVAAIAAGAFRPHPLTLGRNGPIAYSALEDVSLNDRYRAHLVSAAGTGDRELALGRCPTFSRDGTVLAFVSGFHDTAQLDVAEPDGSSPRVLPGIGESEYALSPDGSRIAWFRSLRPITSADGSTTVGLKDELWVTPVSGGPGVRIVPVTEASNEWYSFPVWSPDGRQIAFAGNTSVFPPDGGGGGSYRSTILLVDADGSNLHPLTTRPGTDQVGISWSPDGRYIAYDGLPDGSPLPSLGPDGGWLPGVEPSDIFVINADGAEERNLTNSKTADVQPEWAPDGAHLAYEAADDVSQRLTTVRMEGPVVDGPPILGPESDRFAWAPDGTELLSLHVVAGSTSVEPQPIQSTIVSVDAEFRQSPTTLLTVDVYIPCAPSWQRLDP